MMMNCVVQTLPVRGCRRRRGCRWPRTAGAPIGTWPCPTSAAATPSAPPCTAPPPSRQSRRGTPCTCRQRTHTDDVEAVVYFCIIPPNTRNESNKLVTYDRLRLTMSSRGVVDSPAILAVTSTRMSEGRPAMSICLRDEVLLLVVPLLAC